MVVQNRCFNIQPIGFFEIGIGIVIDNQTKIFERLDLITDIGIKRLQVFQRLFFILGKSIGMVWITC